MQRLLKVSNRLNKQSSVSQMTKIYCAHMYLPYYSCIKTALWFHILILLLHILLLFLGTAWRWAVSTRFCMNSGAQNNIFSNHSVNIFIKRLQKIILKTFYCNYRSILKLTKIFLFFIKKMFGRESAG